VCRERAEFIHVLMFSSVVALETSADHHEKIAMGILYPQKDLMDEESNDAFIDA